ncbi:TetR/AcrR family transcriptional regulator C-terminal domain-containing protein [Streptomyces sp. NPDC018059]|uniref:TetR/AcrR family transcriptional regulator C-terminal domain-containing protein n=1 Tax=Streptomyces sp. NPDC018059 TaxID=3365041 RepID=UPI0037B4B090
MSTRTIYNHFGDKDGLFRAVLLESAESVTAATEALFERHLRKVRDAEEDLLAVDETNARKAARHLALMVGGGVTAESYFGALPLAEAEVEEIVRDGVGIFLRLYGVDAARGPAGAGA